MDKAIVNIAAKVNLTLDVTATTTDGYHTLSTIMASVGVYDTITVAKSNSVRVEMLGRVNDVNNVAYKTVKKAVERLGISGADIKIKKGIPFSGGMGGSSADISGVLIGLEQIYGLKRTDTLPIADALGSDTVFMLEGGIAQCGGRGNDVIRLPYERYYMVIVKPFGGANTGAVFKKYDSDPKNTNYTDKFLANIKNGSATAHVGNALTDAAIDVNNNILGAITDLMKFSDRVSMTGSGSAVFGIFNDSESASIVARELAPRYPYVFVTETVESGAIIKECV